MFRLKTVGLLLPFLLLGLFFTACDSDDRELSEELKNRERVEAAAGPLGRYEETVYVKQVIGHGKPEDAKTKKGTTPQTNAYLDKLEEMLNIKVVFEWAVPTEQFEQRFSLAIASGDLPDVLMVGMDQFEKFKEQEVLADLTDAYHDYASDRIKDYMAFDDEIALNMVTEDGKILGIPSFEDPYMSAQFLWIRKDWLNHLNLDLPESLEDLEQVAQAFVDEDPNQSGEDDTYGLALHKDLISWGYDARGLFYTMGAYPNAWIKNEDGKLIPGDIQPETKEALEVMNRWYESGIIDQEFGLKDMEKVIEDIVSGKVGISFGEWWYPNYPLSLSKEQDPEADWIPIELPSYKGEPGKTLIPSLRLNYMTVATKDFPNPEAAVKMLNFYAELEKPEYRDEVTAENGYVYNWFQPRMYPPNEFHLAYDEVNEALAQGLDEIDSDDPTSVKLFSDAKDYLAGDEDAWGIYFSRIAPDGGWGIVERIRESGNIVLDEFSGSVTPTMVSKGSSLDKMIEETFIKIIMGREAVDEFEDFSEDYLQLGGSDIIEEVNEWYQDQ